MDTASAFASLAAQLAVPLAIAVPVTRILEPATRAALRAHCGSDEGAEFWGRTLRVLWLMVPVAFVLFFFNEVDWRGNPVGAPRQIIALALIGMIASVLVVAWCIARSVSGPTVPRSPSSPAAAEAQP